MPRTRVPDVLSDSLPNRNQLRHDSAQFIKRHLPGDHTTAKLGQVLHPRLLQGPAKTQHQEVDHCGDFQQSKNPLMSQTKKVQEHISRKLPSIHKTMPVTAFVAEYPQNRRADTTNADREGCWRQTCYDARQGRQLWLGYPLTPRLDIDADVQQGIAIPS